jgi:hypothetical protein
MQYYVPKLKSNSPDKRPEQMRFCFYVIGGETIDYILIVVGVTHGFLISGQNVPPTSEAFDSKALRGIDVP